MLYENSKTKKLDRFGMQFDQIQASQEEQA